LQRHRFYGKIILRLDAIHERGLCRRAVSVTFVYCVETAKDMAIVAMEGE